MTAKRLELTWFNKDKALIPAESGRYGYKWVDPRDPRYCETHTLVMDDFVQAMQADKDPGKVYSDRADIIPQKDNLLILGESGDVLEALTRVPELAEKYVGKVKLIYIDPPFNTAQTFSSYEDNLEHSIWLTMMRDRLLHMKKLLSSDGSIWVHLDDVENHRMRLLLDEVFGTSNFITEVSWERVDNAAQRDSKGLVGSHDYIAVYSVNAEKFVANRQEITQVPSHFNKRDEDGNWYCLRTLRKTGSDSTRESSPNLWFEIEDPSGNLVLPIRSDGSEGRWRWSRDKVAAEYDKIDWIEERNGQLGPFTRIYFTPGKGVTYHNTWRYEDTGSNRISKSEISKLFPHVSPFSTPKPEKLLERIIHIGSNPGDVVLDVFGGSGTTAAVAQKMGRRWVTCELLEETFETFTKPRLEKVITNRDGGGISRSKGDREFVAESGIAEVMSADEAAKFTQLLNKALSACPEWKKSADIKSLKNAAKTKRVKEIIHWRGGGGFQVAHLSPACFDYDAELDRALLTPAATGQQLIDSVAANLGFKLLHSGDGVVFDARRGKALLKVIEGAASVEIVDWLATQIRPGETIVLAATTVMDGVREHLRKTVRGSRVVALPDDIFRYNESDF
ncbi:DNA methylase [Corynebacterium phocae]|uniref:DNA methylase n=1 Tax=Corynebacterium phocae TaxID=161895 RepID=A0A1L7D4B8_9CORY|nr:site-specific DNA-methyltransferase [Corynebacterium phocae]APT92999.1 DNA methylase [Corynebacterium phocae]KAA8723338.1 site-specific DNA-methyltransferase [Corynebacterium phocae]